MDNPTQVTGRRILAFLIDGILGFGLYFLLVVLIGEHVEAQLLDSEYGFESRNGVTVLQLGDSSAYGLAGDDARTVNLIAGAWWIVNLVLLQGLVGASVGKLVAGIRVVRQDGRVCGIGKAIIRWLLLIVDAFPYFAPLVGFVCVLATPDNRRVGDMAAGTYVVRSSAVGRPVAAGGAAAPAYGAPAYGATAPPPQQPAADAQWDPARNAWIRWDGTAWTQHDPTTGGWRPL